ICRIWGSGQQSPFKRLAYAYSLVCSCDPRPRLPEAKAKQLVGCLRLMVILSASAFHLWV
ncbi:hypothetical protein CSUI_009121, partial [Cystoisospora suis]